ncbi:hypothetical protein BKA63DRAFT_503816 [Paraphoma chrysanthemicola]|nr:hypothetical protein BKA63DRAFT_503816 [Paraphoma chrysanthemicola]
MITLDYPLSVLTVQPHQLPRFCFANRQLHREGLQAWLRQVRLHIPQGLWAKRQIESSMDQVHGWQHVRCLSFLDVRQWAGYYTDTWPADLALRYASLRRLRIIFTVSTVLDDWRTDRARLKTSTVLRQDLNLNSLFALPNLRRLNIAVVMTEDLRRVYSLGNIPWSSTTTEELRKAVDHGFEEAGKKDVVGIGYIEIIQEI